MKNSFLALTLLALAPMAAQATNIELGGITEALDEGEVIFTLEAQTSLKKIQESGHALTVGESLDIVTIPRLIDGSEYSLEFKNGIQVSLMPDATCNIKHYSVVFEASGALDAQANMQPVQYISNTQDGCTVSVSKDGELADVLVEFKRPVAAKTTANFDPKA